MAVAKKLNASIAKQAMAGINKRIQDSVDELLSPSQMRDLALTAIDLIVKRTRLGYGVRDEYGEKEKFPNLSEQYINFRRKFRSLSGTTSATKSNLTLTGQLLNSIGIVKQKGGGITIAPKGTRDDGLTNIKLAEYVAERHDRVFMRLSALEFNQLVRYYRKTFGDLLKKRNLLR